MNDIPSNYNIPYSKLKSYIGEWCPIDEKDKTISKTKRCREIIRSGSPDEVLFSHTYTTDSFSEKSIVGTNQIKDHCLSMMINQIIGFDISSREYIPPEEANQIQKS